jgi:hypothetical protein
MDRIAGVAAAIRAGWCVLTTLFGTATLAVPI